MKEFGYCPYREARVFESCPLFPQICRLIICMQQLCQEFQKLPPGCTQRADLACCLETLQQIFPGSLKDTLHSVLFPFPGCTLGQSSASAGSPSEAAHGKGGKDSELQLLPSSHQAFPSTTDKHLHNCTRLKFHSLKKKKKSEEENKGQISACKEDFIIKKSLRDVTRLYF